MKTIHKIILAMAFAVALSVNAASNNEKIVVDNVLRIFYTEGARDEIVGSYSIMHEKSDERGSEILIDRLDRFIPSGRIASVKITRINKGAPMKVEFVRSVPGEYWVIIHIHEPSDVSGSSSK